MAHELFGKRFLTRDGIAAWHGLGTVYGPEMAVTALNAFEHDPYIVTLEALRTSVMNPLTGQTDELELPNKAIVRWPTPDDAVYRTFGVVGPEYALITPEEICNIWDKAVGVSISTYGVLNHGQELFITVKMPGFDIKGDEHEMYLIMHSPWNGLNAYSVFQAPIRVVCKNTLRMAQAVAGESFKVAHTDGAGERLARWMAGIYNRALERTEGIQVVLNRFADVRVDDNDLQSLIEQAFPLPNQPRVVPDRQIMEKRQDAWNIAKRQVERYREQVDVLFHGKGWGSETEAFEGTLFGFYNAAVEAQDWGPAREGAVAYDVLFGKRAEMKVDAFNVAYNFAELN